MQYQVIICLLLMLTVTSAAPPMKYYPYYANLTACFINGISYEKGDLIPSDHPCEICRCRPPGFSCNLKHCPPKPIGCREIDIKGQCCPDYDCGCTYDGRIYYDGQRIPHSPNPCVTCYCKRNIVRCALNECRFRYDCEPEYVIGQCCPRYDHCNRSIPTKVKFRSSILQDNLESRSDDTTEIIKIMKDEHSSKSLLSLAELTSRSGSRSKKIFGELKPGTEYSSAMTTTPETTTQQTTQPTTPITMLLETTTGEQQATLEMTTTLKTKIMTGATEKPPITTTIVAPSAAAATTTTTTVSDVDEIYGETARPPYEMEFANPNDDRELNTIKSRSEEPNFYEVLTDNPITIATLITTTPATATATPTTATILPTTIKTETAKKPLSSSTPSPLSSTSSNNGKDIETEEEYELIREESFPHSTFDNVDRVKSGKINSQVYPPSVPSGYISNIYANTMSFLTSLFGRFG